MNTKLHCGWCGKLTQGYKQTLEIRDTKGSSLCCLHLCGKCANKFRKSINEIVYSDENIKENA